MNKIKTIHFVGVKGVGMAPLAIIAKEAGFVVTGCDIADEFITDEPLKKAGVVPMVGFSKDHIKNCDLVITTGAHGGFDNLEVVAAKELGIPVWTQGTAVGKFMNGEIFGRKSIGISVTGSHGKTTTTAMLATVLKTARMDPSYVVGTGNVPSLGSSGHFGRGQYFIAEADEYANEPTYDKTAKFLLQAPEIAIFTNIELDHPDLYRNVDDVRAAFLQFAKQLPQNGMLIVYGGDTQIQKLLKEYIGQKITYGFTNDCDIVITKIHNSEGGMYFWLSRSGSDMGEFKLSIIGEHNVLNAAAVVAAGLECGVSIDIIKKGLVAFTGSKRRSEFIGKLKSGAYVFDDYAHHPTEIKKTLESFRKRFPKQKIVCVFQPHTYSRTKILFEEFSSSFLSVDIVIITDIYSSLREAKDETITSEMLVKRMKKYKRDVYYLSDLNRVIEYITRQQFGQDTVVITMGAGDVYKINEKLEMKNEK